MRGESTGVVQFAAIRTKRIYVEIVNQIKAMLGQGELQPGGRLPPERELAAQFNVGRPAVREALSALEIMGLIDILPGQGAFVKKVPEESEVKRAEFDLAREHSPLDLLEARRLVEPCVAELAAARAGQDDLDRLNKLLSEMRDVLKSGGQFSMAADMDFHIAIGEATQNILIAGVSRYLCSMMGQHLWKAMTDRNLLVRGRAQQYAKEHDRIVRAIQAKDAYAARHAMFEHLSAVMDDLYSETR